MSLSKTEIITRDDRRRDNRKQRLPRPNTLESTPDRAPEMVPCSVVYQPAKSNEPVV
jgi:hypothetical protein